MSVALPSAAVYAGALVLTALVAAAVLHGRRRYPIVVIALVIIFVFTVVLVAVGTDPLLIAALVGAAGAAASRMATSRSRRI